MEQQQQQQSSKSALVQFNGSLIALFIRAPVTHHVDSSVACVSVWYGVRIAPKIIYLLFYEWWLAMCHLVAAASTTQWRWREFRFAINWNRKIQAINWVCRRNKCRRRSTQTHKHTIFVIRNTHLTGEWFMCVRKEHVFHGERWRQRIWPFGTERRWSSDTLYTMHRGRQLQISIWRRSVTNWNVCDHKFGEQIRVRLCW